LPSPCPAAFPLFPLARSAAVAQARDRIDLHRELDLHIIPLAQVQRDLCMVMCRHFKCD